MQGPSANVSTYSYATTNNQLVDISPTGKICAGTWNRNSGGGIPDYTICNFPIRFPRRMVCHTRPHTFPHRPIQ